MRIEDVIEALNVHINNIRREREINSKSQFVLQKQILLGQFKAYKTYIYNLWFINGDEKYLFIKVEFTKKVTNDTEEAQVLDKCNKQLCVELLNQRTSHAFEQVIAGVFEGWSNLL